MGANEKHEATYHGVRHDPDLNLVRAVYAGASPVPRYDERAEAFDRMIAHVRAEAKAEALREAATELDDKAERLIPEDSFQQGARIGLVTASTDLANRANQYKEEQ